MTTIRFDRDNALSNGKDDGLIASEDANGFSEEGVARKEVTMRGHVFRATRVNKPFIWRGKE